MIPRPRSLALALAVLLVGGCGDRGSLDIEGPVVAWVGGSVWDGETFASRDLLVADGRVVDGVKPDSTVSAEGRFIVPAFGDAHSHSLGTAYSRYFLGDFVDAGVLYGLDLTNPASGGMELQRAAREEGLPMDLAFSHGGLSTRRGTSPHPATVMEAVFAEEGAEPFSLEGDAYWTLDSVQDVGGMWPALMAQDPDVVKVYLMNYGEGEDGCGYGLCADVVEAVVGRAHAEGLRVFAHVSTTEDVRVALATGVDALAHLPLGNDGISVETAARYRLDDALIDEIGRRGMVITPTSHLMIKEAEGFPSDTLSREIELQAAELRALHAAGARLALSGHDWQVTSRREAEYLVAYDIFAAAVVLELWAGTTPRAIYPDREVGHLRPGAEATFLLLRRNPAEDFSAVRDIAHRVHLGETIEDAGEG